MKKIIVTGPTGAIGMALVEMLISMEIEVTAICHSGSKRIKNLPKSPWLCCIECDLENIKDLVGKLDETYDVFFHFAWAGTSGASRNDVQTQISNIQYTLDAVELANSVGCKKFIGAGSQAEYGRCEGILSERTPVNPENGYGMAKLCAGQMSRLRCEQLGMEHVWVRVLSVYGPYDGDNTMTISIIKALLRGEVPHCTKGEQIWDYIHSKDVARAFIKLVKLGKHGKVYCLGSGKGRPLAEYIKIMRDVIDPNLEIGFGDVPYSSQQVMYLCADISELTNDTGFVPQIEYEDGIKEVIEWVRKVFVND